MRRYCGYIGFAYQSEDVPGIWTDVITRKKYYGDIIKNTLSYESPQKVNKDIVVSNSFSIVADSFIRDHIGDMKYIEYLGYKWEIKTFEEEYPRILLTTGGLYNENET